MRRISEETGSLVSRVIALLIVVGILSVVDAGLPEGTAPLLGIHRLYLVLVERGGH